MKHEQEHETLRLGNKTNETRITRNNQRLKKALFTHSFKMRPE